MGTSRPVIALLNEAAWLRPVAPEWVWYADQIRDEDARLSAALEAVGLRAERVAWDDAVALAQPFAAAVIRATWDYHTRLSAFEEALASLAGRTRLVNPWPVVAWNLDKRYLLDLAARGVAVVPTRVVEPGGPVDLMGAAGAFAAEELIAKPAVSGGARDTFRLDRAQLKAPPPALLAAMERERYLLQPFQSSVLGFGEISLVVIAGRVQHAVRKVPKAGDFRVQDDHGGRVLLHTPTPDEIAFAEGAVAAVSPRPAYARVDAVRDAAGRLALMELELIEPELFLRFSATAAPALALAIAEAVVAA
jgi:glutathione synthase/RimK-type ligase-like ATP-grasp enzyme